MGARGPVPKRSTERHGHRATDDVPDQVEQPGKVDRPEPAEHWHPTARGWYDSLAGSGQSRFYEPSDWQQAHFCADLIHRTLTDEKINAQLVAQVRGLMADLLSTEAARRRVSMEIVRVLDDPAARTPGNVTSMVDRRKRVSGAS